MIHIRAARTTDAGTIGAILTEFTATTEWMPFLHTGAEDIAHAGRLIDRGWVTVAEVEEKVVGFAACDGTDLDALYVYQSHRGNRIGTALLEHLKRDVDNLTLWTFQANKRAQRFYLRHGFAEVDRTNGENNDERLPDIKYEWKRKSA